MTIGIRWFVPLLLATAVTGGCATPPSGPKGLSALRQRAGDCLKRGITYPYLPSVRTGAIEALAEYGGQTALPWIRNALIDESPAVRFSAAMALGDRRDEVARPALRKLYAEGTATDRIGAIYALHHLGDTTHTGDLARYLLEDSDATVRGNAALVLGRIGGEGAVRLLSIALTDSNPALRVNVLEAMARLGNEYAISTLHENAYGGIGVEEVFAINTLAELGDPKFQRVFRLRLDAALHIESKLAAARALGKYGDASGYAVSADALNYRARGAIEGETTENRTRRVRQMAADALGAIGDPQALPALARTMDRGDDPRTQVYAARAILEILNQGERTAAATRPPTARRTRPLGANRR